MSETDSFLASARAYAEQFDQGDLAAPPTRKVAILTCMDARLDLYGMLGLSTGDAHILRNAGGVVTDDAIRSLALSQHLLGTEEIVLVHHTGCGLLAITDAEFDDLLEAEAGKRPQWRAHAFADIEQDVRDGTARLRSSPFIPHKESIRGFVYEVETGFLREVE